MSDPRVFFAAERTLLAWIRTGLTVMAFGFLVARFGLFPEFDGNSHAQGGRVLKTKDLHSESPENA